MHYFFLFDAKWGSITWLSTFRNLHIIIISIQQICHLVNARRKVNTPIFRIWISWAPESQIIDNKSDSHFSNQNLLHPVGTYSNVEVMPGRSHISLRVFRALGQFREMSKSPQIIGMNKQKYAPKPSSLYFTSKLVFFKLKYNVRVAFC